MKSMSFMGGLLFFSLYPLRNKFNPDASLKWKIKKEVAPLEPPPSLSCRIVSPWPVGAGLKPAPTPMD
jgi:hypothetical protein